MPETNLEEANKKIAEYEKRMGIGMFDPAKDGYLVLVKLLGQQNDYLSNINIKTLVTEKEEGTKKSAEYERAKGLWEKLPDMIKNVSSLRSELKMEGEEKKEEYQPVTAESLANRKQF